MISLLLDTIQQSELKYLALDSRQITFPSQSLFFAIKGQRQDGHQFIGEAYEKGIRHFVVSEPIPLFNYPYAHFYTVKNSVATLQQLAINHRKQFNIPVIGITGSNGKTVVKEWLYQLLGQDQYIVRSPKSYNSQVGVPLSVWQLKAQHDLAIFEAGISKVGEMAKLQPIIQPTMGIFTNIGAAHSKGFVDDQEKIMEKLKLFRHADYLIYCRDYSLIEECIGALQSKLFQHRETENTEKHGEKIRQPYSFQMLTWTKSEIQNSKSEIQNWETDLSVEEIIKENYQTTIIAQYHNQNICFQIPFIDDGAIENAIHCCLLMLHLGYHLSTIQQRMKQLSPIGMRLELKAGIQQCSLINDCYNSDIQSLVIALGFLQQQNQQHQKTVILSDLLQSGSPKLKLYQEVVQLLQARQIHRFIGIGQQLMEYAYLFNKTPIVTQFFPNTNAFLQEIPHFYNETILIKGARSFSFEYITKVLSQQIHDTILEINLNAIAHNLHVYKQLLRPKTKMMVMVKALSYGSGSFEIANVLQFNKVDYLAVAYTDEGVALRKAGIQLPIMVMNPTPNTFSTLIQYQLEPEIYSFSQLQQFISFLQIPNIPIEKIQEPSLPTIHHSTRNKNLPYPIHLKLDTGMHRLGFEEQDIPLLIQCLKQTPALNICSILSHLAASDEVIHDNFSTKQIAKFEKIYQQLAINLNICPLKHILNSTGIVRLAHAQMDMVRLGLGLYGIDTTNTLQQQLMTVGTLKTHITQIKTILPTETVGYGRKGKLKQCTKIATVSIGYGDGLSRQFSNGKGKMWIKGQLAPIIGNVCMDMTMLEVSHIKSVQEGDEVIVFGPQLPVQQLATVLNTIPYEVLTAISPRVKRVYFQE